MTQFDRRYYERFYLDPKTRVTSREQLDKLGDFVCSYLQYLPVPVARALDLGCGIGLWREVITRHFPGASYQGVEISAYLCETYGWKHGSVVDYRSRGRFDLVICQGVLPYLDDKQAKLAIANLGALCRGALYLEAVTKDDYESGIIDRKRTDGAMKLRSARWYRRALSPHFEAAGGGVFVSRRARAALYALERA